MIIVSLALLAVLFIAWVVFAQRSAFRRDIQRLEKEDDLDPDIRDLIRQAMAHQKGRD